MQMNMFEAAFARAYNRWAATRPRAHHALPALGQCVRGFGKRRLLGTRHSHDSAARSAGSPTQDRRELQAIFDSLPAAQQKQLLKAAERLQGQHLQDGPRPTGRLDAHSGSSIGEGHTASGNMPDGSTAEDARTAWTGNAADGRAGGHAGGNGVECKPGDGRYSSNRSPDLPQQPPSGLQLALAAQLRSSSAPDTAPSAAASTAVAMPIVQYFEPASRSSRGGRKSGHEEPSESIVSRLRDERARTLFQRLKRAALRLDAFLRSQAAAAADEHEAAGEQGSDDTVPFVQMPGGHVSLVGMLQSYAQRGDIASASALRDHLSRQEASRLRQLDIHVNEFFYTLTLLRTQYVRDIVNELQSPARVTRRPELVACVVDHLMSLSIRSSDTLEACLTVALPYIYDPASQRVRWSLLRKCLQRTVDVAPHLLGLVIGATRYVGNEAKSRLQLTSFYNCLIVKGLGAAVYRGQERGWDPPVIRACESVLVPMINRHAVKLLPESADILTELEVKSRVRLAIQAACLPRHTLAQQRAARESLVRPKTLREINALSTGRAVVEYVESRQASDLTRAFYDRVLQHAVAFKLLDAGLMRELAAYLKRDGLEMDEGLLRLQMHAYRSDYAASAAFLQRYVASGGRVGPVMLVMYMKMLQVHGRMDTLKAIVLATESQTEVDQAAIEPGALQSPDVWAFTVAALRARRDHQGCCDVLEQIELRGIAPTRDLVRQIAEFVSLAPSVARWQDWPRPHKLGDEATAPHLAAVLRRASIQQLDGKTMVLVLRALYRSNLPEAVCDLLEPLQGNSIVDRDVVATALGLVEENGNASDAVRLRLYQILLRHWPHLVSEYRAALTARAPPSAASRLLSSMELK